MSLGLRKFCPIVLCIIIVVACTEIGPVIPALGPPDLGNRKVLIEEFTGVQCVNCPQGSAEIENLIGLYGAQLIAVSIHAGFFSDPYSDSRFDLRTEEGEALEGFLGEPLGYPSAVINRKKQLGRAILQLGQASWASAVAESVQEEQLLSLNLELDYDEGARDLDLKVALLALENISDPLSLSIMITENDIVDQQLTPGGKNSDYVHKHVLRDMLTDFKGQALGVLDKGQLIEKNYDYSLLQEWKAEDCKMVVFVSFRDSKEVLEVEEAALLE